MFDETGAQEKSLIIRRTAPDNGFPSALDEWVLSGPHIGIATAPYKTPMRVSLNRGHYENVDLETLPSDYMPRTNYWPQAEHRAYIPAVPFSRNAEPNAGLVTDFYRLAFRRRLASLNERTLFASIVPPGPRHIHPVISAAFRRRQDLLAVAAVASTVVADFLIKVVGISDLYETTLRRLPLIRLEAAHVRTLLLACVTSHYAELWASEFKEVFRTEKWARVGDPRLPASHFQELPSRWTRDVALRTDYARRMLLVELDVMVAQQVGLTFEELLAIYRAQFPVMQQYERDTWYDIQGRIVFTISKGLLGVGLPRKGGGKAPKTRISYADGRMVPGNHGWEDVRDLPGGTVIEQEVLDDTLPNGPHKKTRRWVAPFATANREEDYRIAWEHFAQRARDAGEATGGPA
jgi:hypothetical protein